MVAPSVSCPSLRPLGAPPAVPTALFCARLAPWSSVSGALSRVFRVFSCCFSSQPFQPIFPFLTSPAACGLEWSGIYFVRTAFILLLLFLVEHWRLLLLHVFLAPPKHVFTRKNWCWPVF